MHMLYDKCFVGIPTEDVMCTITSTSLTTLNTAGGQIPSGTQNVILYCLCLRGDIVISPAIWFHNGTEVVLTQDDGTGSPYFRPVVPSQLIIPSFVSPYNGAYGCARYNDFNLVPSHGDSITLNLSGMHYLLP